MRQDYKQYLEQHDNELAAKDTERKPYFWPQSNHNYFAVLRVRFGYRHQELADLVGISSASLLKIEHKRRRRSRERLTRRIIDKYRKFWWTKHNIMLDRVLFESEVYGKKRCESRDEE